MKEFKLWMKAVFIFIGFMGAVSLASTVLILALYKFPLVVVGISGLAVICGCVSAIKVEIS